MADIQRRVSRKIVTVCDKCLTESCWEKRPYEIDAETLIKQANLLKQKEISQ